MRRDYFLIIGLALLFFFPFLGSLHLFDGAETGYAECAREMLLTGDWLRPQVDFQPFMEWPPLFFWLQTLSMKMVGVNEFAARFPNAICGLVTLLLVYRIGLRLHDRMFAWLWVLAWLGSFLPHFYFRSGMMEPWSNLLIFCALYGFIEFRWQFLTRQNHPSYWQKYRYLFAGGGLLGLAILMKGGMVFLVVLLVLSLYWARYRFNGRGYLKHLVLFSAAAWFVPFVWLGLETARHGMDFAPQFIAAQMRLLISPGTEQGGFFGSYALVLLAGAFPVSVFALPNLWGDHQPEDELLESDTLASCQRSDLGTWMQLLFWVAFLLFSIAPAAVVHDASLCFFPLTYLGAVTIWRAVRWEVRPKVISFLLPVVGVLSGLVAMAIPWLGQHPGYLRNFFADNPFALEALKAEVGWEVWQGIPGFLLIAVSVAGAYLWLKNRPWPAAQVVFVGGAVFAKLTMVFILCNIEGHFQGAAVEFYKSKRGESCVIKPIGFKTFAHLFYTCKQPDATTGKTYFVAKTGKPEDLLNMPECHELYRKNGFVFFERIAE